jgi:hypothetical protein
MFDRTGTRYITEGFVDKISVGTYGKPQPNMKYHQITDTVRQTIFKAPVDQKQS